jgi:hypothetical protein
MRQNKDLEPLSDSTESENALEIRARVATRSSAVLSARIRILSLLRYSAETSKLAIAMTAKWLIETIPG